jgi:hypothetical protein
LAIGVADHAMHFAEDDVAMEIVALVERSPLVADEASRLIVSFRRIDRLLPGTLVLTGAWEIYQLRREGALRKLPDDFECRIGTFACLSNIPFERGSWLNNGLGE